MQANRVSYCGFVAIVGRPNVGKSTLLNRLLAKKISITSRKPQTTRHRIVGIDTKENYQVVYVDTPGLRIEEKKTINRLMNKSAASSFGAVELVIFVVEGTHWTKDDQMVLNKLKTGNVPVLLVINKIDNVVDKKVLLPYIDKLNAQMHFVDVIPISAKKGDGVSVISAIVKQHLPEGEHHFPDDYITNRSQSFIASEIIREKLIRSLGDELPYEITVEIERFIINDSNGYDIHGLIFVDREGQKKIVIGSKGTKIKQIGIDARRDMQVFFGKKVRLKLWVKVKSGWADDERTLHSLGYSDDH